MPCDSIQTVTVSEKLENVDIDILKTALESMGFQVSKSKAGTTLTFAGKGFSGSYSNGRLKSIGSAYGPKLDINQIKVAYSHAVIQKSALAYGWKLTKTGVSTYKAQKG